MTKDACMLESPCSEISRDAPICLCLQLILETCTKLQRDETPPWESVGMLPTRYWPWRPPTDHFLWWKPEKVVGQPLYLVGRPVFAAGFWFSATRSKREAWQGIFNICVHDHSSHHCIGSRECRSRSSGHQSRISMHDGRGTELHNLIWNECTYEHVNA